MRIRWFQLILAAGLLLGASPCLVAQPSTQPDDFLERMERVQAFEKRVNERQPPETVMDAVGVKAGMVVGEVGAGRGRYTMHLSRRVGRTGTIYANDIDPDALAFLRERCHRDEITNIETILGEVEDPHFPKASLDMIFMVWVYHMVESPVPLLRSFAASLKPGAPVVMVEPPPEEIEQERREALARGASEVHITVLRKAVMEDYAGQAGFELVETMQGLIEKDIIYVLMKQ